MIFITQLIICASFESRIVVAVNRLMSSTDRLVWVGRPMCAKQSVSVLTGHPCS